MHVLQDLGGKFLKFFNINDMTHEITSEEIRILLLSAKTIIKEHKCYRCRGTGVIHCDENGENVKPGYPAEDGLNVEDCDECQGVGYMIYEFL